MVTNKIETGLWRCAFEVADYKRIEKLAELNNIETFYDDVRRLTRRVYSDHSINRWEHLSELRYEELKRGKPYSAEMAREIDEERRAAFEAYYGKKATA